MRKIALAIAFVANLFPKGRSRLARYLNTSALLMAATISTVPVAKAADAGAVVIGTFDKPLYIASAPGEPNLLYVVEQSGRIQVLKNEVRLSRAFLNISDIISSGDESGLLSVAFPPDYEASRRFYVAFTNTNGELEVDEFMHSVTNPTRAIRNSRRIVLTIPHPGSANHNGGQLQFGPRDGLLYISTGDGGAISTPGEPARDLEDLRGKILRIKPLQLGTKPYTIPRSNPFVDRPGRDEVYAYGLRNPWRFAFDGARLIIADVGEEKREEVNFLRTRDVAGVNFGWPEYEGDLLFDDSRPGADPPTFPIFTYDHLDDRCAIIGGFVVHAQNLPKLSNRFLYGDLCTGEVRSFQARVVTQKVIADRPTGITLTQLSGFGLGASGQIYLAQISGKVYRLVPPSE